MSVYTAAEVLAAAKTIADIDTSFPMVMDDESAAVLQGLLDPPMAALPEDCRRDEVAFELLSVFSMGLAVGAQVERKRWGA